MAEAARASIGRANAIALLIGAQVALHAAQSDWKRMSPVERGQAMNVDSTPAPSGSMRLIFEYDADRVRILQQTAVDISPSTLPTTAEGVGLFVDVRDVDNRTLARVPAPAPSLSSLEVFPERHDQPITRTDAPRSTGAFTVVVPMTPTADHVTLVRVAADANVDRGAALHTFDLISFPLKRY